MYFSIFKDLQILVFHFEVEKKLNLHTCPNISNFAVSPQKYRAGRLHTAVTYNGFRRKCENQFFCTIENQNLLF